MNLLKLGWNTAEMVFVSENYSCKAFLDPNAITYTVSNACTTRLTGNPITL
jgi:hypothetical protein